MRALPLCVFRHKIYVNADKHRQADDVEHPNEKTQEQVCGAEGKQREINIDKRCRSSRGHHNPHKIRAPVRRRLASDAHRIGNAVVARR